jgi:hypothetical protein
MEGYEVESSINDLEDVQSFMVPENAHLLSQKNGKNMDINLQGITQKQNTLEPYNSN